MVRSDLRISSSLALNGAFICVPQATASEREIIKYLRANKINFEIVKLDLEADAVAAYDEGRCDVLAGRLSQLYFSRLKLSNPSGSEVLPEVITKQPMTRLLRRDDPQWQTLVHWVFFVMLNAEELAISSLNIDHLRNSDDPNVRRLIGQEGAFGENLGLANEWAYQIIKLVGSYGESFERNLGFDSPLNIPTRNKSTLDKGRDALCPAYPIGVHLGFRATAAHRSGSVVASTNPPPKATDRQASTEGEQHPSAQTVENPA